MTKSLTRSGHAWFLRVHFGDDEMAAFKAAAAAEGLTLPHLARYAAWRCGYLGHAEVRLPLAIHELIERRLPEMKSFLEASRALCALVRETDADDFSAARAEVRRAPWFAEIDALVLMIEAAHRENWKGRRDVPEDLFRCEESEDADAAGED